MNVKMMPADIAVDLKKSEVRLIWQDGMTSVYSFDLLRQACPCATCNELRRQRQADPLFILTPDQAGASSALRPENPVQMVGQYGLQFFWADGHRTGIYTFDYLRELSE